MFLRIVVSASMALCVSFLSSAALNAAPLSIDQNLQMENPIPEIASNCDWISPDRDDIISHSLSDAIEAMSEICIAAQAHDANLLGFANAALSNWIANRGTMAAQIHRGRFLRALAALEAHAELLPISELPIPTNPALMLEPLTPPLPEAALFTVEETAVPFLGLTEDDTLKVRIAIEAPGYSDLFTIYFPRGTAHLTLAAEDMIDMAAESIAGMDGLEIWIAPAPALNETLAVERAAVVYQILRRNDVDRNVIRIDDGGYDAILNRPNSLSDDTAA